MVEEWAFLVLVPGYVVYHTLVLTSIAPPIFGGVSTPLSMLVAPFVCGRFLVNVYAREIELNHVDIVFGLFISVFGLTVAFGSVAGTDISVVRVHLAIIFQFLVIYLTIRLLGLAHHRPVLYTVSLLVIAMLVFLGGENAEASALPNYQLEDVYYRDYQGYALCMVIAGILALSNVRVLFVRILLEAIILLTLFVNGARSEFFAAIPVIVACELFVARSKVAIAGVLIILSVVLVIAMQALADHEAAVRILSIIEDRRFDASFYERLWAHENAVATIWRHPFIGAYASYPVGLFAHSILSTWVDFGLTGFLLYGWLVFSPLISIARYKNFVAPRINFVLLGIALTMCISTLLFKAYTYKLLPVLIGVHACYIAMAHARFHAGPVLGRLKARAAG